MVSVPHCRFVIQWSAAAAMRGHFFALPTCHRPQLAIVFWLYILLYVYLRHMTPEAIKKCSR